MGAHSKRKNSFKLSKMFRWLKDRKKRPGDKEKTAEDDYGFRKKNGEIPSCQNDYGFHKNNNKNINRPRAKTPLNESSFHIYEEILDLPELPEGYDISNINQNVTNEQFLHSSANFHLIGSSQNRKSEPEGPYMVVPIVCKQEIAQDRTGDNSRCNDCGLEIISNRFPCTCRCRRKYLERLYSEPWDSSESSCSVADFALSQSVRTTNIRNRRCERVASNSSDCSCGSGKSSMSSRSGPEVDGNDTCCEYDMSTSSESDVQDNVEYRTYLDKVQQNLLLKQQVKHIIRSLGNTDNFNSEDSSNTLERSDVESTTAASSVSGRSSQPTLSGGEISDPDVPADRSESDDSSGYYESTEASGNSDCVHAQEHVIRISQTDDETKSKHALNHKRYRSHRQSKNRENTCAIAEDTEMYLLPANRRDSDCDNVRVFRKPLLPPQQTLIYQDPHRPKAQNSNRLLCDLIRMNYDKQHMIHV